MVTTPLLGMLLFGLATFQVQAYPGENTINQIKSLATQGRNRAQEARDAARESRDALRESREALVGTVKDAITEAAGELADEVNERREFRQAFLDPDDCGNASDCGLFRLNIIMLVEDLGTLSNALFIATELDTRIETAKLTNILDKVPGRALYPLYRAFAEELNIFESNFVSKLSSVADNIESLEDAVISEGCDRIMDPDAFPIPITDAIRGTKISASGLELVGGIFEAISTKSIIKEGAVWGWVGVSFKNNRLKNIGVKFKTAGEVLGKYSNIASTKLMRCTIKDDNQKIMAALGTFDPDTTNLDAAVSSRASQGSVDGILDSLNANLDTNISTRASQDSINVLGINLAGLANELVSRASQASVDDLAVTLGDLDVSNVDVVVSSRASQASVDALRVTLENLAVGDLDITNLDVVVSTRASQSSVDGVNDGLLELGDRSSLALRIQIERQLADSKKTISAYYLPEAYGGLLELVREIVDESLMQNVTAGISVKNAEKFMQDGDLALGVSDYKKAFKKYRKAYQVITR